MCCLNSNRCFALHQRHVHEILRWWAGFDARLLKRTTVEHWYLTAGMWKIHPRSYIQHKRSSPMTQNWTNGRPSDVNHLKLEDYDNHNCNRVRCSCLHIWLSGSEHVFAYCGLPASHLAMTFLTGKVCFPASSAAAVVSLYFSFANWETREGSCSSDYNTKHCQCKHSQNHLADLSSM